eukprot:CAMPEP_0116897092 /NCGR_PEP_ID=MMETSP0467-20121206/6180_1 /TAXON_ID=283647 /ORGANISM="Mesodinium pulex, Strain SPMC105" /LENGTH=208 /DNA_ID=CAMNT_0004568605 /DNA_START=1734 /DNA_END=2360 /DNA_ORIENTATION=-
MKIVLQRRSFIDENNQLTTKGELASMINSGDEILMTEILLSNFFEEIDPAQIAAILSVFVNEKAHDNSAVQFNSLNTKRLNNFIDKVEDDKLKGFLREFYKTALLIGKVQQESGIDVNPDAYADSFSSSLCQFTLFWAEGKPFQECLDSTDEFEGSIVRVIRRLEQLIEQLIESTKIIHNLKLTRKLEESRRLIKRGICFAASLWVGN